MKTKKLSLHDFEAVPVNELLEVKGGTLALMHMPEDGQGGGCGEGPGPGLPGGITQMFGNIEQGFKNWFNDVFGSDGPPPSPNYNIDPDHMNGCSYCPPVGTGPSIGQPGQDFFTLGTALQHYMMNHKDSLQTGQGNCN